ncbi:MAG TPA: hypothetical protein VNZ52_08585 [Candidatus Thermoplasmatota archaeon]|nr:hypothetical protein [Candidatus Thermoplasmatota archaeon]
MAPYPKVLAVVFAGLFMLAGTALHLLEERGSYAQFNDREASTGNHLRASVPTGAGCVLFANRTAEGDVLRAGGDRNRYEGCLHGNGDVAISGRFSEFNRTVRYTGVLKISGKGHRFAYEPFPVNPEPMPHRLDLLRYAPGGQAALDAAAKGKYFLHAGSVRLNGALLQEGLHYVQGTATIETSGLTRNVTVVATRDVRYDGIKDTFRAFRDGLLFGSLSDGSSVIEVGGNGSRLEGIHYTPLGDVRVPGSGHLMVGQLLGHTVRVTGDDNVFRLRSPGAIALSRTPGVHDEGARVTSEPPALTRWLPSELPTGLSFGDFDRNGVPEAVLVLQAPGMAPLAFQADPPRFDGFLRGAEAGAQGMVLP